MIRRGEYLRDQPLSMAPGCEVVGRVAATGPRADVAAGTRVAGWIEAGGGYADRAIVPAHRVYPVPDDLPAAAIAAVFLQGTTAHYAVHRFGRARPGERVLVLAASGGVGGIAVQLAAAAGAFVVGAASTAAKRALVAEAGAGATVDSSDPAAFTAAVREATAGQGADVVVDGVGGALFQPSMRALAVRGRYVVAGSASQQPATLDVRHLLVRNQLVCGFILAHIADEDPREPARALGHLCDLVREGTLAPRYELLPLEDAPDAHRRIEDRTLTGKVVLEVEPR
jgi:NADPH2:quinone reductase